MISCNLKINRYIILGETSILKKPKIFIFFKDQVEYNEKFLLNDPVPFLRGAKPPKIALSALGVKLITST